MRYQRHARVLPLRQDFVLLVAQGVINLRHVPDRITHETSGIAIADEVMWARGFAARLRGLIGRDLEARAALVLEPASQIHTFAMAYPIDVLFCDADWSVRHVQRGLRPNRITRWVRGSRRVVELPAGSIPAELAVGDRLVVS